MIERAEKIEPVKIEPVKIEQVKIEQVEGLPLRKSGQRGELKP